MPSTLNTSMKSDLRLCVTCGREHSWATYRLSECKKCLGRRSVRAVWAAAAAQAQIERAELIGVSPRFCQNGRVPSFEDDGLKDRLAIAPLPLGGLHVFGPVGTHKTHLVAARTVDAARRGYAARLIDWPMLALEVRDTYKRAAHESEKDILDRYLAFDFLAIDDFGTGRVKHIESDAALRLAYLLFNERYNRTDRITDVVTNKTPDELAARFDPLILRRIREMTTPYVMLGNE